MCDFDYEAYKYNLFEQITDEDIQRFQFTQRNVKLYAFKAVYELEICGTDKNAFYLKLLDDDEDNIENNYSHHLSELQWQNEKLTKKNKELKQQLSDCKKDEEQLSFSFMGFKMQLIEVLQQNYNYAYNQRQKNLDKSIVARNYEVLYQTIDNIAETMNVDIERFPKGEK